MVSDHLRHNKILTGICSLKHNANFDTNKDNMINLPLCFHDKINKLFTTFLRNSPRYVSLEAEIKKLMRYWRGESSLPEEGKRKLF